MMSPIAAAAGQEASPAAGEAAEEPGTPATLAPTRREARDMPSTPIETRMDPPALQVSKVIYPDLGEAHCLRG